MKKSKTGIQYTTRLTSEGKYLLIIECVLLFAAVNSGKNLLFLIFSVIFSAVVLSYISAKFAVSRLKPTCKSPVCVFAGDTSSLSIQISNMSRFSKRFLTITETSTNKSTWIDVIQPRDFTVINIPKTWFHRGFYDCMQLKIGSSYPFGFVRCEKSFSVPADIIVYPRIAKILSYPHYRPSYTYSMGLIPTGEKGEGQELFGLRAYNPGDSLRTIHWRSTARLDKLMVREFEAGSRQHFTIFLDTQTDRLNHISPDYLETGISLAAGLIKYLLDQVYPVLLAFPGTETVITPHDSEPGHLYRCLEKLARLQLSQKTDLARFMERVLPYMQPGETVAIVPLVIDNTILDITRILTGKGFSVDLLTHQDTTPDIKSIAGNPRVRLVNSNEIVASNEMNELYDSAHHPN